MCPASLGWRATDLEESSSLWEWVGGREEKPASKHMVKGFHLLDLEKASKVKPHVCGVHVAMH